MASSDSEFDNFIEDVCISRITSFFKYMDRESLVQMYRGSGSYVATMKEMVDFLGIRDEVRLAQLYEPPLPQEVLLEIKEAAEKASKEDDRDEYQQEDDKYHRSRARWHLAEAKRMQERAQEFSTKSPEVAEFLAKLAMRFHERSDTHNRRAVEIIMAENNCAEEGDKIDLHHLFVHEAVDVLDQFLGGNWGFLLDGGRLLVITGRGLHSPTGKPRVKPAVMERLGQYNLRFHEENPGMLAVYI